MDIDAIARAILVDEEIDYIDAYCAISSIMLDPAEITQLADALEICPIHRIAFEICLDDQYDNDSLICPIARDDIANRQNH